ncbi:MAG: NF041680 family putative transposase [Cyanobacteria bacterium J06555_3]
MPQNNYNQSQQEFQQFRDKLYQTFNYRRDTVMDLVDAIAANTTARSPVELSLSSLFPRKYSALYKGIQEMSRTTQNDSTEAEKSQKSQSEARTSAIAELISTPKKKQFYLWAIDVTPLARPYAKTLEERNIIYQPNTIKGNKPINIGHSYSVLTSLPEREETGDMSWAIPLTVERVKSDQTGKQLGSQQLQQILSQSNLPWSNHLSVVVVDSDYSAKTFLTEQEQHTNLVVVTRVRSNRVFYTYPESQDQPSKGHPQWYGDKFDLKDETTWHEPNEIVQTNFTTKKGRLLNVKIRSWSEMLMRGSHDCPMHRQPFSLIQIQVTTTEGIRIWKPMWLIMVGQRRNELTITEAYQSYRQRYDIEHLLRFGKQKLLLNAIATPELEHEENWVQLIFLAYVQLWAARKLALTLPRPWERYLPRKTEGFLSPSQVQRDLNRIITEIGTPAHSPKRRGYSQGRMQGMVQTKRTRHEVIKKGQKEKKPEPTPIAV